MLTSRPIPLLEVLTGDTSSPAAIAAALLLGSLKLLESAQASDMCRRRSQDPSQHERARLHIIPFAFLESRDGVESPREGTPRESKEKTEDRLPTDASSAGRS